MSINSIAFIPKTLHPPQTPPSYSPDLAITRISGLNHRSFASDILIFRLTNQKLVRLRHGLHLHTSNICKADHPHPKVVQTASCFSSSGIREVSASCAGRDRLRGCGGTQCNASLSQACCCSCFRKSGSRVSLARVDHEYDDVLWFE